MEQLKERQWEEETAEEEEEEEVVGLEKRRYRHGKNETTNLLGSRSSSGSCSDGNVRSESTITDIGSGSFDVGEFTRKNESSNDKEEDSKLQGGAVTAPENGGNNVHFDTVEGTESTNGYSGIKYVGIEHTVFEKNLGDEKLDVTVKMLDNTVVTEVDHQKVEIFEDETFSTSVLSFPNSCEKESTILNDFNNDSRQDTVVDLTESEEKQFLIHTNVVTEINNQNEEILEDATLSDSGLSFFKSYEKESKHFKDFNVETKQEAVVEIIEENNREILELDVERVLEKQDTHDLYCPNCNSCITRKVILRRKKPRVRNVRHKAKVIKPETKVGSELDVNPAYAAGDQSQNPVDVSLNAGPTPEADDHTQDRKPDVFRCLSCFSLFIPSGSGFKLFKSFRNSNENGNLQIPQKTPPTSTNRFFSLFKSNKGKTVIEQGNVDQNALASTLADQSGHASTFDAMNETLAVTSSHASVIAVTNESHADQDGHASKLAIRNEFQADQTTMLDASSPVRSFDSEELENGAATEPQKAVNDFVNSSTRETLLIQNVITIVQQKPDDAMEKNNTDFVLPQHESDRPVTAFAGPTLLNSRELAEDANLKPQQVGVKFLVPSTFESSILEQSETEIDQKYDVPKLAVLNGHASSEDAPLSVLSIHTGGLVSGAAKIEPQPTGLDTDFLSTQGSMVIENIKTDVRGKSYDVVKKSTTGGDVVLTIETSTYQRTQNTVVPEDADVLPLTGTQTHMDEQTPVVEASEARDLDILKSIVYGGLIESITSLGIVSSAAGAGATTLNIVVLALANLIGGLFIIGHNLIELRNDTSGGTSNQTDWYQELLGRRENFVLHAVIAVLSFLIFGLVAPLTYAFSFRVSDNREYKLSVVAAACLVCITLLAIGKSHVRKPPKSYIKTVLYYVIIGFMSSGISYVVGTLIDKLLEQLGWFESSLVVTMPLPETGPNQLGSWASY